MRKLIFAIVLGLALVSCGRTVETTDTTTDTTTVATDTVVDTTVVDTVAVL